MDIIYIVNIKKNNSCDNRLKNMIDICGEYYKNIHFHVIFNDKDDMKKHVETIIKDKKIDLLLCNYGEDYIINLGLPVIILERYDSCTLTSHNKQYLNYDIVKGIFKEYTCSDGKQNNINHVKNRLHYTILNNFYNTCFVKCPPKNNIHLSEKSIGKIKPVNWNLHQYSFICNSAMEFASSQHESSLKKPIDVFFVCNPHEDHDILYKHRSSGQNKLRNSSLYKKYNIKIDHINNRRKYRETVIKSKICVCPYGLGSRVALDQLSILGGSITIKPHMNHVNTTPDIYKDDFFEYVNYDWDDLLIKIEHILNNWDSIYKQKGLDRRNRAINQFDKKYYVDTFINAVQSCINI
jgi:hypothetical protein